ncbi:hypothetical protein CAEBREN_15427 [Caenorhabditis brenneri]|uniref:Uncharacterized protein n=1 Tax=Caenorhabditis brenneri TaxID=135651 RepID=G0N808_CAEBE|nr:hypothetical protein CAEBREN_15427 [Caenorhabditis brenneri]
MPPKIDDIHFSCYTTLYLFVYIQCVITYFTGNLCSIIFFQFKIDDWILLGAILLASLVSYGVVYLVKTLVTWIHRKWNISQFEQCRNEVLIGLAGVTICGIVPRILVYFVEHEDFNVFFLLNFFIITAILFGFFFVNQHNEDYQMTYELHDKTSWILIVAHSLLLCILIATSTLEMDLKTLKNWERTTVIILCHVSFYVMCASSTIEIWKVIRGDLKVRDEKEKPEYFGMYGLWERLKKIKFTVEKPKVVQKSDTWPDVNVNHGNIAIFKNSENGLDDNDNDENNGTITVMTRWTSPTLEAIPASPIPEMTREEEIFEKTKESENSTTEPTERTVKWLDE